jgi:hypothetical protein
VTQQLFKIEGLTAEEVNILGVALDELPRKISQPLVIKIQEQINFQLQPPTKPKKVK